MLLSIIDPSLLHSYKFKLEDGAEIKPYIPLLNNRVYDTKFESQFYTISDANKVSVLFLSIVVKYSQNLTNGVYRWVLCLHLVVFSDFLENL